MKQQSRDHNSGFSLSEQVSDLFKVCSHKDQLIYGAAYLFWGIIAFVETGAYASTIQLAITLTLMTSLFTIFAVGSQQEKFKPEQLIKVDMLMSDWRFAALTVVEFFKFWVCLQTLQDTNSIASWFFLSQADSFFIYIYNFAKNASNSDEERHSSEITQQKFIGLSLWIIGYFLELIFGGQITFTSLCLLIYALSVAETIILKYQKDEDKLTKMTSFNFEDNEIKINFAKAKFIFSVIIGVLYGLIEGILYFFRSASTDIAENQSKSFVLFIVLAVLTLLREKYEKQINKKFQQNNNLLGKAIYLPLVFLCFSFFMLNKLPALQFFLHLLFLTSYGYFYLEDFKQAIGFDTGLSVSSQINKESLIYDFIKTCYENSDSRKIAIFFIINLIFMFVELVYGYMSNSLGLITDSFHMLFDCMALFIGLCASYIAKMGVDRKYTYGYGRVETLSGLFNGIFLVFIAFNVFCESIERIYEPQRIQTDGLLMVSTLGFCVNLIGLFFFHDHHDHSHGGEGGHDHHDHENENMYGVFLHVLADTLGSVGVIFSSVLVKYYDMYIADPICSFIISLMILASGIPFIQMTASNLILKTPAAIKKKRGKVMEKLQQIEDVISVNELLIWEMAKKKYVATVDLFVGINANRSQIHDEVSTLLRGIKVKDITVQMTCPNRVPSEIAQQQIKKLETNTEDDLNQSPSHRYSMIQDLQYEYNNSSQTEQHTIEQDLTDHAHAQTHNHKKNKNKKKGAQIVSKSAGHVVEADGQTVSEHLGLNKRHKD